MGITWGGIRGREGGSPNPIVRFAGGTEKSLKNKGKPADLLVRMDFFIGSALEFRGFSRRCEWREDGGNWGEGFLNDGTWGSLKTH